MKSIEVSVNLTYTVIVPAAGVGKRMRSVHPKQYLFIDDKTILEHTARKLLSHPNIKQLVIVIGAEDKYFTKTSLAQHPQVSTVIGGVERVDSVLAGLQSLSSSKNEWVLVHDAARPCIAHEDISALINYCHENQHGAILATPVRDTMKHVNDKGLIEKTIDRHCLWHASTPQMYKRQQLIHAITTALQHNDIITDEASAMEASGYVSGIVQGRSDNIKITQPEDLPLAEFIIKK